MRYLFLFICLIFIAGNSFAQDDRNDMNWRQKLEKANELMLAGSYYNAIELYKEVLEERPERGDVALNLGNALYSGRNYYEALEYYKKAYEADEKKYKEAQFYHGLMLKMTGQYQPAVDQLKDFYRTYRAAGKEGMDMKKRAKDEYEGAELALSLLNDTAEMVIKHLSNNVNAIYTEFNPRPVGDSLFIFSSLKVDSVIVLNKEQKKMPRARLYQAYRSGDSYTDVEEMTGPFNDTKEHTGNGVYSPDGKRFYFTRCTTDKGTDVSCDIFMSVFEKDKWSEPKALEINDKKANDSHPFIVSNKNNEILFFSSDREGGEGGSDIWMSYIYRDGSDHRSPQNLGRRINTPGNEITPFYDEPTEVLYYSSDREINVGGYDVFKSKGSGRRWAKPINMGFPVNSSVDDMYYVHNADGEKGFIVSNRKGSISPKWEHCCDDIFAFNYIVVPKFVVMGYVYSKADTVKKPIENATVQIFLAESNAIVDSAVSDPQKPYDFFIGSNEARYRVEARKEGYISGINTTSTVGLTKSDTLMVDVYLTPISEVGKIVLRNVYFDLDKAFIREDAKPSLDTIYTMLVNNPNIKIELSSHTDSRASKNYNLELSQRRADSSKAYLVSKGIDPERIVAKGYGENRLLNNCADGVNCTEIEHQLNRRTEFEIIGEIPGMIISYDKSEIERVKEKKRKGTLKGTEDVWEFEEPEQQEQ